MVVYSTCDDWVLIWNVSYESLYKTIAQTNGQ